MAKLKRGDKVTVREGATSVTGHKRDPREVRTVLNPNWDSGHLVYLNTVSGRRGNLYRPEDVIPFVQGPQWSDVEPGDKVTIRVRDTGEELTTTATHRSDAYGQAYNRASVLGLAPGLGLPSNRWELVSIKKPKPQPPTTPGSHVTVPFPGWESGINHLFLLESGEWLSQTGGGYWPAEDVASKDFTVIHDAGAQ